MKKVSHLHTSAIKAKAARNRARNRAQRLKEQGNLPVKAVLDVLKAGPREKKPAVPNEVPVRTVAQLIVAVAEALHRRKLG